MMKLIEELSRLAGTESRVPQAGSARGYSAAAHQAPKPAKRWKHKAWGGVKRNPRIEAG